MISNFFLHFFPSKGPLTHDQTFFKFRFKLGELFKLKVTPNCIRQQSVLIAASCSGESNLYAALCSGESSQWFLKKFPRRIMQQIVKSLSCKMQRRVKYPLCIAAETFDYLLHLQQGDKSYRCIIQRGIKPYNCIVQPGVKSCRYKMQRWTKFGSPWRKNHVKSHI
jgi:hypothetical protein